MKDNQENTQEANVIPQESHVLDEHLQNDTPVTPEVQITNNYDVSSIEGAAALIKDQVKKMYPNWNPVNSIEDRLKNDNVYQGLLTYNSDPENIQKVLVSKYTEQAKKDVHYINEFGRLSETERRDAINAIKTIEKNTNKEMSNYYKTQFHENPYHNQKIILDYASRLVNNKPVQAASPQYIPTINQPTPTPEPYISQTRGAYYTETPPPAVENDFNVFKEITKLPDFEVDKKHFFVANLKLFEESCNPEITPERKMAIQRATLKFQKANGVENPLTEPKK